MSRHRCNWNDDFAVAADRLTIGGVTFRQGQPFDKRLVTPKRLRRLFDQRSIVAVTAVKPSAVAPSPAPVANVRLETRHAIPDEWRKLLAEPMKTLAARFAGTKPGTKAAAIAVIEAEFERRGETG